MTNRVVLVAALQCPSCGNAFVCTVDEAGLRELWENGVPSDAVVPGFVELLESRLIVCSSCEAAEKN